MRRWMTTPGPITLLLVVSLMFVATVPVSAEVDDPTYGAALADEPSRSSMELSVTILGAEPSSTLLDGIEVPLSLAFVGASLVVLACLLRPFTTWRLGHSRCWLSACRRTVCGMPLWAASVLTPGQRAILWFLRRGVGTSASVFLKVLSRPGTLASG